MKRKLLHLISICLFVFLSIAPALAQSGDTTGRSVTQQDWLNYMPVLIGSIIIVLIVDAIFILPIIKQWRNPGKNEE